jgi:hypothetical protein
VTARIKNTTYESSSTQVATPEETIGRKKKYLGILDKAIDKIADNLESGKMALDSSLDLDRIIKLSLLVSGEADSITGKSGKETTQEMDVEAKKLSMSKIESILDLEDPEVKAMYDKLYDSYNKLNDEVDE